MVSGFCQPFLRPASPPSLARRQRGRSEVGREVPSFPNRKSISRPPHTGTGRQTTQRGTRPCLLSPLQNWRSENRRKKWKGIRPITQESRELRNNVLPFPVTSVCFVFQSEFTFEMSCFLCRDWSHSPAHVDESRTELTLHMLCLSLYTDPWQLFYKSDT